MSGFLRMFQVFEKLFEVRYRRRYDARLQLMAYQIRMLQARIDTDRIYTCPEERAELTRLGAELDHDIDDVMLVVKRDTYRGWLREKKGTNPKKPGRPRTSQATVDLVMRFAVGGLLLRILTGAVTGFRVS
jgi:putative transposase